MRARKAWSSSGFVRAASNARAVRSSGARCAAGGAATFWASACDERKSIRATKGPRTLAPRRARPAHIGSHLPFEAFDLPCGSDSTISPCNDSHLERCNLQLTFVSQSVHVHRLRFLLRDDGALFQVATGVTLRDGSRYIL